MSISCVLQILMTEQFQKRPAFICNGKRRQEGLLGEVRSYGLVEPLGVIFPYWQ